MDQPFMCLTHKQPALFYDRQLKSEGMQFVCKQCVQQRFKIDPIEEFQESLSKPLQKIVTKSDQSLNLLKDLLECLQAYKQNLIKAIENLQCNLNLKHQILQDKQQNIKLMFKQNQNITDEIIIQEKKSIMDIINEMNDQLQIQLNTLVQTSKTDKMFEILNNYSLKINLKNEEYEEKQQEESQIKSFNEFSTESSMIIDKKFDYQLMQQTILKQNELCYAIDFNKDATIMIAGCYQFIKVFEFQNDKLIELQKLSGHSNPVFCLKFMKKSNQFISGSTDSTMIIWELNQNLQWQSNQILKDHKNYIYCIIINQNEDLLISGSIDNTIKFWSTQDNTWRCNQSIDCQSYVYCISLNDQEDQLITSVYNNLILVIELQAKEWMIQQRISVEQYGFRLCHINKNQFLFQPRDRQHLQIFDYDAKDQIYKKGQDLQYQHKETGSDALFPIQYISKIGLIIVKNNHHCHLIKRNQNGTFIVEQSINFNVHAIYGCISDDGRYIATWDSKSKEIQIRRFEY